MDLSVGSDKPPAFVKDGARIVWTRSVRALFGEPPRDDGNTVLTAPGRHPILHDARSAQNLSDRGFSLFASEVSKALGKDDKTSAKTGSFFHNVAGFTEIRFDVLLTAKLEGRDFHGADPSLKQRDPKTEAEGPLDRPVDAF